MIYILKWHVRPDLRTYANGIVEMLSNIRAVREASCPKTHFKLVKFTVSVAWGCGPTVAGVLQWEQRCSKFERPGNSHLILLFGLCSFSARWGKLVHYTFCFYQTRSLKEVFQETPTVLLPFMYIYLDWNFEEMFVILMIVFSIGSNVEIFGVSTTQDLRVKAPNSLDDFYMSRRVKWRWRKS